MKLSVTATAVLDQMPIIDPDYFKRRPPSEDEMDDEYSRFLYQVEATTRYENFVDALEKELELEYLHIQDSNSHYAEPIRPPKTGDLSFNEICSMGMDSFHYWLQEASIEELEVFGKFAHGDKKRKRKRNIIQLLLGFLNYGA